MAVSKWCDFDFDPKEIPQPSCRRSRSRSGGCPAGTRLQGGSHGLCGTSTEGRNALRASSGWWPWKPCFKPRRHIYHSESKMFVKCYSELVVFWLSVVCGTRTHHIGHELDAGWMSTHQSEFSRWQGSYHVSCFIWNTSPVSSIFRQLRYSCVFWNNVGWPIFVLHIYCQSVTGDVRSKHLWARPSLWIASWNWCRGPWPGAPGRTFPMSLWVNIFLPGLGFLTVWKMVDWIWYVLDMLFLDIFSFYLEKGHDLPIWSYLILWFSVTRYHCSILLLGYLNPKLTNIGCRWLGQHQPELIYVPWRFWSLVSFIYYLSTKLVW